MPPRSPKTDDQRVEIVPLYRPFINPIPIPTAQICDAPAHSMCVSTEWMPIIHGLLAVLDQPDIWDSEDEDEIFAVRQQVREFASMGTCLCGYGATDQSVRLAVDITLNNQLVQIFTADGLDGVAPDRPDTFFDEDSGDSGDEIARRQVALCWAVFDYIVTVVEKGIFNAFISDSTTIVATGVIAFLVNPLAGLLYAFASEIAEDLINKVANNPSAIEDVACCMLEALQGVAITEGAFTASLDGCGFALLSDEAFVADAVKIGLAETGNFLAFVAVLGGYMNVTDILSECPCEVEEGCFSDFGIDEGGWTPRNTQAVFSAEGGWKPSASPSINDRITIHFEQGTDIRVKIIKFTAVNTDDEDWEWSCTLRDDVGDLIESQTVVHPAGTTQATLVMSEPAGVRELVVRVLGLDFPSDSVKGFITSFTMLDGDCIFPSQPVP